MEEESAYELILKNPKRTQMFFLATIEKPRSIDEVAKIWNVSRGTFVSRGLEKKMVKLKLLRVVGYEKRALKFEANFEGLSEYLIKISERVIKPIDGMFQKTSEAFREFLEKNKGYSEGESPFGKGKIFASFKGYHQSFIESLPQVLQLLDRKEVRSAFSEEQFMKMFRREHFLDPLLLFKIIKVFIEQLCFVTRIIEKGEEKGWDEETISRELSIGNIYFAIDSLRISLLNIFWFSDYKTIKQLKDVVISFPFYKYYIEYLKLEYDAILSGMKRILSLIE